MTEITRKGFVVIFFGKTLDCIENLFVTCLSACLAAISLTKSSPIAVLPTWQL